MTSITNIKEIYAALLDGRTVLNKDNVTIAIDKWGDITYANLTPAALSLHNWTIVPDSDGWIKYYGHGQPVADDVAVSVKMRNGKPSREPDSAENWQWGEDYEGTITHYKIHKSEKKPQRTGWFRADAPFNLASRVRRELRSDGAIYDEDGKKFFCMNMADYSNIVWEDDVNPPLTPKQWLGKALHTTGFVVKKNGQWGEPENPTNYNEWAIVNDQGEIMEGPYPIQVKEE